MQARRIREAALGVGLLAAGGIVSALDQFSPHVMVPTASAASRAAKAMAPLTGHPAVLPASPTERSMSWSDAEIISALGECVGLLAPIGAEVELLKPIRNGQCGFPAPVRLKRVAGVELDPPAVVNCRMAAKVRTWIVESLQPLAVETLGTRVRRLVTAAGYMCRQRIGSSARN